MKIDGIYRCDRCTVPIEGEIKTLDDLFNDGELLDFCSECYKDFLDFISNIPVEPV